MIKFIKLLMLIAVLGSPVAQAYEINGMYAKLISCKHGKYGYDWGYIGTYEGVDNQIYTIYFGNDYCEY